MKEAEMAAIGLIITNPDCKQEFWDLKPHHFEDVGTAALYKALIENESPLDAIRSVNPELFLPHSVNDMFIACTNFLITWYVGAEQTKTAIFESHQKRTLQKAAETGDIASIIEAAKLYSLQKQKVLKASSVQRSIIEALQNNDKPYSTGLRLLDEAMEGGLYANKSYAFCARKKMGKTMLAATISANLNNSGVKHLFICGEMSPEEILQRMLCRELRVESSEFRLNKKNLSKRIEQLEIKDNLFFRNAPGLTFDELKHILDHAVIKLGVKGVILDYWQLVGGKKPSKSTAEHLDEVAQYLADYSRQKGLFNITFAQINQEGNTRGGEGIRLAFDQVYDIKAPENDPSTSVRYLEMMETRYTQWQDIGSESSPRFKIVKDGLFFEEI
jgi:replicative DNA helicase